MLGGSGPQTRCFASNWDCIFLTFTRVEVMGNALGFLVSAGRQENRNKEDSIFVTKLQSLKKVPAGVRASLDSGGGWDGGRVTWLRQV